MSTVFRRRLVQAAACAGCLLPATGGWAACPAARGREFQVNEVTDAIQQSASVAAGRDGGFVVAWQSEIAGRGDEIRARRFDACGRPRGAEIAVNALTAGSQNAPAVALDAEGGFVVVWQSLVINDSSIRARRFDAHGVPRGDEIAVSALADIASSAPAIGTDASGNFAVVWETALAGSYEIRARLFDSHGMPRGNDFTANAVTAGSQRSPSVAMGHGGDFVVVWCSNVAGSFEIRARRFTALGAPRGGELAVNAVTAGDQRAPAVAMDASGNFVAVWENSYEDRFEIRARRFNAMGLARGADVTLSPGPTGDQFAPSVAMDGRGDLVVAWHGGASNNYEVRARAFAPSGAAMGAEMAINTTTMGTQKAAAVALDGAGSFVVTWHGDATGSWEIAAHRHRLPREALGESSAGADREAIKSQWQSGKPAPSSASPP